MWFAASPSDTTDALTAHPIHRSRDGIVSPTSHAAGDSATSAPKHFLGDAATRLFIQQWRVDVHHQMSVSDKEEIDVDVANHGACHATKPMDHVPGTPSTQAGVDGPATFPKPACPVRVAPIAASDVSASTRDFLATPGVSDESPTDHVVDGRASPETFGIRVSSPTDHSYTRPSSQFVMHGSELATADDLSNALRTGHLTLKPASDGEGGTYMATLAAGITVAVFKPSAEEIGVALNPHGHTDDADLHAGFAPGECYKREVLAYQLDHEHFAGIPETVTVTHATKGVGSAQCFLPDLTQSWSTTPGHLSSSDVRRIAIFDLRTLNCDRHGGNLLVDEARYDSSGARVVPIDHAYCFPDGWSDPDFEWAMWPQAMSAFTDDELDYIRRLSRENDATAVASALGDDAADVVFTTTTLLKIAAPRGYTAREIAAYCRRPSMTAACGLEVLLAECRQPLSSGGALDVAALDARINAAFPVRAAVTRTN